MRKLTEMETQIKEIVQSTNGGKLIEWLEKKRDEKKDITSLNVTGTLENIAKNMLQRTEEVATLNRIILSLKNLKEYKEN